MCLFSIPVCFTHVQLFSNNKNLLILGRCAEDILTYPLGCWVPAYGSTALVDLDRFFSFLIYTKPLGLLGLGIRKSQGRYLHIGQHKHRINAQKHPCLKWDWPTIPVFERTKTFHVLNRATIVIGVEYLLSIANDGVLLMQCLVWSRDDSTESSREYLAALCMGVRCGLSR
jgi:hypothetical protein